MRLHYISSLIWLNLLVLLIVIEDRVRSRLIDLRVLQSWLFMVVLNHVIWQPLVLIVQMGAVALNSLLPKPIIVTLNSFSNLDVLDVRLWLLVEVYFSSSHSCRLRGLLYLLGVDGRGVYVNLLRLLLESVIGVFSRWHREVFMRHRVFVSCRDWVLLMIH